MNQQLAIDYLSGQARMAMIELEAASKMHFLGWNGFKRMFMHRKDDRDKALKCSKKAFVDYSDINIPFMVSYDSGNNAMTFESVMVFVLGESNTQIIRLRELCDDLWKNKEIILANKMAKILKEEEEEHKYLKRMVKLWNNAKAVNDVSWVSRMDIKKHKHYKEKYKNS